MAIFGFESISLSWCYHSYNVGPIQILNITASSIRSRTEPQYVWDDNYSGFNSTAVRKQLGAVVGAPLLTEADRQILKISPYDMDIALKRIRQKPIDPINTSKIYLSSTLLMHNVSIGFCPVCGGPRVFPCNAVLANLMADALDETHSPAVAIQAAMTAQARMEYYSVFNRYMPVELGAKSVFQSVRFPQTWRGFGVVVAIIAAQLLTFLYIAIQFVRHTNYSFLDNVWPTVSQVSESSEIRGVLEVSKAAKDKDVAARIRGTTEFHGSGQAFLQNASNSGGNQPRLILRKGIFKRLD